jgi:hypothetical protein
MVYKIELENCSGLSKLMSEGYDLEEIVALPLSRCTIETTSQRNICFALGLNNFQPMIVLD